MATDISKSMVGDIAKKNAAEHGPAAQNSTTHTITTPAATKTTVAALQHLRDKVLWEDEEQTFGLGFAFDSPDVDFEDPGYPESNTREFKPSTPTSPGHAFMLFHTSAFSGDSFDRTVSPTYAADLAVGLYPRDWPDDLQEIANDVLSTFKNNGDDNIGIQEILGGVGSEFEEDSGGTVDTIIELELSKERFLAAIDHALEFIATTPEYHVAHSNCTSFCEYVFEETFSRKVTASTKRYGVPIDEPHKLFRRLSKRLARMQKREVEGLIDVTIYEPWEDVPQLDSRTE